MKIKHKIGNIKEAVKTSDEKQASRWRGGGGGKGVLLRCYTQAKRGEVKGWAGYSWGGVGERCAGWCPTPHTHTPTHPLPPLGSCSVRVWIPVHRRHPRRRTVVQTLCPEKVDHSDHGVLCEGVVDENECCVRGIGSTIRFPPPLSLPSQPHTSASPEPERGVNTATDEKQTSSLGGPGEGVLMDGGTVDGL